MRYYLIAGEASGDLHGSNLIKELRKRDDQATIRCWGGDLMEKAGAQLVKHYRDLAFMGFVEVLRNLRTIFRNLDFCKKDILEFNPDVIILIDYPGFNIRIAKWAKEMGIRTIYYISPQVWAWKENRVKTIKRCVDLMLVILPFEKEFYHKWQYEVEYVGHPLIEVIKDSKEKGVSDRIADKPIVALLPGSRKQEILKKLPVMLETSKFFPDHQFVVAQAPGLEEEFYSNILKPFPGVKAIKGKTYDLLKQSTAALVTSGTATLETALFEVPEVVCYKGSPISYMIAKRVIKVKYISLVNLIMDKLVVKELIQDELSVKNLQTELSLILFDKQKIDSIKKDYKLLWELLSKGGNASAQAAAHILDFLKPNASGKKSA